MFESLLIANRGEIAVRIIRTAQRLGIRTIAVYSEADADAMHVQIADEAVGIGPAPIHLSYARSERILEAALATGAEAIHPGYGLLSESSEFARAVKNAGLVFVGPTPETIEAMGDKVNARSLMAARGVPIAHGSKTPPATTEEALEQAQLIGYPLMLKAAAGGGGIGMAAIKGPEQLVAAFETASERASRVFGSHKLLLEKLIMPARHIEVQILGLTDGSVIALGERDCSVQRRFQKVVEETPACGLDEEQREAIHRAAVRAGEAIGYQGAGTVEFLVNAENGEFAFLEMNTRLQVEHPITELVTGLDLVELQLRIAAEEQLDITEAAPNGHAIEFRLYAEDPVRMLPSPGRIDELFVPRHDWLRVDAGYKAGDEVTPFYDPLVAKICVWGETRAEALDRANTALAEIAVNPLLTNLPLLHSIACSTAFVAGSYDTGLLSSGEIAPL
ncbi:acetyl-CoA carboxylase biotin carboxylase subunit [Leucobacter chinensis]|uniref:acetyl-CoA carboxylase biotin carboxylase subunit n=1 Tax=Leucobacter chinensis TaxID=2851010 RepID=UPI001C21C029|nr:biotin carboxylase N-terminal domain-containing protein [Leucobacter chinensis]